MEIPTLSLSVKLQTIAPDIITQEQPACVSPGVYDGQTSVLKL